MKAITNTAQEFIAAVKGCKGQYLNACITTTTTPAAAHKSKLFTKRTTGVFRTGIEYSQLKAVREAVESGQRSEPGELPWGEWAVRPWVITHKECEYVRLYPLTSQKPKVEYFIDGEQVEKDEFNKHLTPSAQKESPPSNIITTKLGNVRFIGCYTGPEADEE